MIYLIHCKNFHKCYNVPLPSRTIKKRKKNLFEAQKKKKTKDLHEEMNYENALKAGERS
jgi:hypothetical protein